MSVSDSSLLECRDVCRVFQVRHGLLGGTRGEVAAVDGVSLYVNRGETLGLVGESGCGKSTLARMIAGLMPVSSGEILFDRNPLSANIHGRLQMVFQDPFSSLNPRLRVGLSIAEPLLISGLSRSERREKVAEMLHLVGLQPEYATRYPHEFSGGQRQRIAIARALVTHPELVICDEAVSALDASVQAQVLNLLRDAQASFGLSYLFISHDLAVVGFMSDRIAVMYLGRIVEEAPKSILFDSPAHPYTQALLSSMPSSDPGRRADYRAVPGELPTPFAPPPGCAFHPRCPRARPLCQTERPERRSFSPDHAVCCHFPGTDPVTARQEMSCP